MENKRDFYQPIVPDDNHVCTARLRVRRDRFRRKINADDAIYTSARGGLSGIPGEEAPYIY